MPDKVLIDSDILSYFLRGTTQVQEQFDTYIRGGGRIRFSIITYYEIVSGLKFKDATRQIDSFL